MKLITPSLKKELQRRAAARWSAAGLEPDMGSVLADPMVHALMRSDGLSVNKVAETLASVRMGLLARDAAASATEQRPYRSPR